MIVEKVDLGIQRMGVIHLAEIQHDPKCMLERIGRRRWSLARLGSSLGAFLNVQLAQLNMLRGTFELLRYCRCFVVVSFESGNHGAKHPSSHRYPETGLKVNRDKIRMDFMRIYITAYIVRY